MTLYDNKHEFTIAKNEIFEDYFPVVCSGEPVETARSIDWAICVILLRDCPKQKAEPRLWLRLLETTGRAPGPAWDQAVPCGCHSSGLWRLRRGQRRILGQRCCLFCAHHPVGTHSINSAHRIGTNGVPIGKTGALSSFRAALAASQNSSQHTRFPYHPEGGGYLQGRLKTAAGKTAPCRSIQRAAMLRQ